MSQTTDLEGAEEPTAAQAHGPTPLKFPVDPEARPVRAMVGLLLLVLALALFGLVALWLGDRLAGAAGWALAASAGVYAILVIAACAVPRPSDGDGLALDADGLTLTRAGRDRRWPWRNLGDFTIASRSRPAGWLFGRRISIRVPAAPGSTAADGSAGPATTLCIAGAHLAPDDEIAAALLAFRDRAAGRTNPGESRGRLPGATYHPRDQRARAVKTRTIPFAGLVSWISIFATASVVGGLYDGWQYFLSYWTDPLSHRVVLTVATLFVPYDFWSGLRKLSPAGNRLRIDAGGLLLAVDGRRRRWRWDSVSAPEIQEGSETDGVRRRCIVFIARHDGFSSGPQATPGLLPAALRFIVEDIYDAPLETMAGRMADHRARFRSDPVPAAAALPGVLPLPT